MTKFIVTEKSSKPNVEPGTYPARCFRVLDLGTQHGEYNGNEIVRRQVLITWELSNELNTEGDWAGMPKQMHKFYTMSLHEKSNLRHDLANWLGRPLTHDEAKSGFDLEQLIGKPCLLSVVTTDTGRSKVGAVTAVPKGMDVPGAVNDPMMFHINDDVDWDQVESLPDWIAEIICRSDEYKAKDENTDSGQGTFVGSEDEPNAPVADKAAVPF